MSVPLYLHITEVIPTCHNTLHVESVSVARGRLSKLIEELESGTCSSQWSQDKVHKSFFASGQ